MGRHEGGIKQDLSRSLVLRTMPSEYAPFASSSPRVVFSEYSAGLLELCLLRPDSVSL